MLREAAVHFVRTIPLSRADVIDRLWQLAQLSPDHTNGNITGQVKAAQALEQIFALHIDGNDLLKRRLEGKSEADLEFYVVHGFLPYKEEQEPARLASAEAPQAPESTPEHQPPKLEPANTSAGEESRPISGLKGGQKPAKIRLMPGQQPT